MGKVFDVSVAKVVLIKESSFPVIVLFESGFLKARGKCSSSCLNDIHGECAAASCYFHLSGNISPESISD